MFPGCGTPGSGRDLWVTPDDHPAWRAERSGQAVEGHHCRLYGRATYLMIRGALADELQPRNGIEQLLIDGLAEGWGLHPH